MKLLKYIRASLIGLMILSSSSQAATYYNRCDFKYKIEKINICSEKVLSENDLLKVERKYQKALSLFPDFIKTYGYTWEGASISLTIYMLPYDRLNDQSLFTRPKNRLLQGRYRDWVGKLYIPYSAFTDSNTDFIHELAHYFNNNIPVTDSEQNEEIASKFEQYYLDNS